MTEATTIVPDQQERPRNLPVWPEWMDMPTLARYIGKKPSTVRTLLKHNAIPRPFKRGKIVLWNRHAIDRCLMRIDEPEGQELPDDQRAKRLKAVRKPRHKLHLVRAISGLGDE